MIRLDEVTKRYGAGPPAVDHLSLDVGEGEVCVLVGPSGCGKTTTMKMVNRLIEPTSGRIFLGGDDVTHADPILLRRRIGYVIQNVGLFPHQTIATNVATVPRLLGWDRRRTGARVDELLDSVGLDPGQFARRYPHELSGGQRQRVGVARALAADPPVLLMDEPFGAIDPITRGRLQVEFLRLQQEVRKTIVFVTHDIEEAVHLGDRVAILAQGGRLEQYDTPAKVLGKPATGFVAEFVGADRGLKRLTVTEVDPIDLEHPPEVGPSEGIAEARKKMVEAGAPRAIVVDGDRRLHGRLAADTPSDGTAGELAQRLPAWVDKHANLKQAFSEMLQQDAGWVAVLDGDRYLGVLTPESLHAALRRSIAEQDG